MNAVTKTESSALSVKPASQIDLSPQTFEQALTFANYLADSDLVPKDFKGKPGNCLIAMQWGTELGLKPLQALSNIAVINGRAALWGDAVIALVRSSPACEYVTETDDGHTATCKVKRRNEAEQFRTFSMDDAKQAGLIGKQGPWSQYPKRMRQMRARAFALRDVFPDVLRGLPVAEEIMDIPRDMGSVEIESPWTPEQLTAGDEAAAKGAKAYVTFWKSLGADMQAKLAKTKEHEDFKLQAQRADAARTVEDAPATKAQPADIDQSTGELKKSADQVMDMLKAAKTEDALYVAYDWTNALIESDQLERRYEIDLLFQKRLKEISGE